MAGQQFLPPADEASEPELDRKALTRQRTRSAEMDHRSWYMPKESADALAQLVDDLYWETRQPKQAILAAIIGVVTERRDEVARVLRKR